MVRCIFFLVSKLGGIRNEDSVNDGITVRNVLFAAPLVYKSALLLIIIRDLSWVVLIVLLTQVMSVSILINLHQLSELDPLAGLQKSNNFHLNSN